MHYRGTVYIDMNGTQRAKSKASTMSNLMSKSAKLQKERRLISPGDEDSYGDESDVFDVSLPSAIVLSEVYSSSDDEH